jgi:hypothetical protein
MARRDALLRLHKSLLARSAALRDALAGQVANLRRFRNDQGGDSADEALTPPAKGSQPSWPSRRPAS